MGSAGVPAALDIAKRLAEKSKQEVSTDAESSEEKPSLRDGKKNATEEGSSEETDSEDAITRREEEAASKTPRTPDDFERMLVSEGKSSELWLKYMAYYLELRELNQARAVAERGVKHVGFCKDDERLNVWLGYLNMECNFGTEEGFDAVFKRAIQHNDALTVYLKVGKMQASVDKIVDALKTFKKCADKYPREKEVWTAYFKFLYETNKLTVCRSCRGGAWKKQEKGTGRRGKKR